jgi:hypothetical protein
MQCGRYTAYWNGKVLNTQQEAASGNYVYILEVDGQKIGAKKMIIIK